MLPLRTCEMDPTGPLPDAIWVATPSLPSIYRGSPLDMVKAMTREMAPKLCPRDAIHAILGGLARNRGIHIRLDATPSMSDDAFASLFIFALLDQRVARPLAAA